MSFADLSVIDRQKIIRRVQLENGLHLQIIEKDWWVTAVLRALFSLPYSAHFFQRWNQSEQMLASH